jgi:hypothetical protein
MVLIAGGGVTKAEGIALNCGKKKEFRVRTLGLNPAIISEEELNNRIINMFELMNVKEGICENYF